MMKEWLNLKHNSSKRNHQGVEQQLEGILEKKKFNAEHGFVVVVVCHATMHMDPTLQERFSREDSLLISNEWLVV